MSIQTSGYHLTRPFATGSRRPPKSPVAHMVSFLPLKPSKHMSDGIGNLVLISRLHVAAGQIALAVVVAQSVSVFLGGPG
jgi:hypothetical protein